jgi:hypothetical protein
VAIIHWVDACGAQGYTSETGTKALDTYSAGVLIKSNKRRVTIALMGHTHTGIGRDWLTIPRKMIVSMKLKKVMLK